MPRITQIAINVSKTDRFSMISLSLSLVLFFPRPAAADVVTDWSANAGKAATAACVDPFHESRAYAMMHVAIHDALNAIDRRFRPYAFDVQGPDRLPAQAIPFARSENRTAQLYE